MYDIRGPNIRFLKVTSIDLLLGAWPSGDSQLGFGEVDQKPNHGYQFMHLTTWWQTSLRIRWSWYTAINNLRSHLQLPCHRCCACTKRPKMDSPSTLVSSEACVWLSHVLHLHSCSKYAPPAFAIITCWLLVTWSSNPVLTNQGTMLRVWRGFKPLPCMDSLWPLSWASNFMSHDTNSSRKVGRMKPTWGTNFPSSCNHRWPWFISFLISDLKNETARAPLGTGSTFSSWLVIIKNLSRFGLLATMLNLRPSVRRVMRIGGTRTVAAVPNRPETRKNDDFVHVLSWISLLKLLWTLEYSLDVDSCCILSRSRG